MRKAFFAIAAVALLCCGCAQGGANAGSGSITMYGTIDKGISVHN